MGCALGAAGGAVVRAVLDLSNRPHFASDLPLDEEYVGGVREWDDEARGAEAAAAAAGGGAAAGGEAAAPAPCGVRRRALVRDAAPRLRLATIEVRATLHLELQSDRGATATRATSLAAAEAYGAALSRAIRDPGGAAPSPCRRVPRPSDGCVAIFPYASLR